MIEKKQEEYKEYGQQIGALAKQYSHPNPEAIEQARAQGNISMNPAPDDQPRHQEFVKPNDSVTFTIDEQTKSPLSDYRCIVSERSQGRGQYHRSVQ